MNQNGACFALLDDAGAPGAASRLYSGHVATLRCHDGAGWQRLLDDMQRALGAGRHAVLLCAYELGAHLQGMPPRMPAAGPTAQPAGAEPPAPLAQVLLFERCQRLTQAQVAAWLAERAAEDAAPPTRSKTAPGVAGANDTADMAGVTDPAGVAGVADPADVAGMADPAGMAGVADPAGVAGVADPAGIAAVRAEIGEPAFCAALARIRQYIEAGDTYQVNYTYRLRFDAFGSPAALYARLRARQPVPYGALVTLADGGALLSLSPELFVRHTSGALKARPMKGTAAAAPPDQREENQRRAQALAADPKNRAENLMIVDLLRNDIGRIGVTGSVSVPALFEVARYGAVLQMTSTVEARLRDGATLADIFTALFPCGSITGAPKRRSMEIIGELEASERGVYTGAIGWFAPPADGAGAAIGDFCLSVPIRTLALQAPAHGVRRGEMGVGAGIVHDSDAREEYAECQLKATFLTGLRHHFELFETMHATREDGCRERARHLARLARSARYFGFAWDAARAGATLDAACAALAPGRPFRLRLALDQAGALTVRTGALSALNEPVRVLLAADTTRADELFLRHKTSVRARYDAAWRDAEARGAFDTLFFNERGELTEGGRSNVFVRLDGHWYTPPLACGLLPGVMRAALLTDPAWDAGERVITRAMLSQAQEIMICNALRGPIKATLADPP